ncbi:MAG: hypothetical protein AAFU54_28005 [Chloroflexota bacterium]
MLDFFKRIFGSEPEPSGPIVLDAPIASTGAMDSLYSVELEPGKHIPSVYVEARSDPRQVLKHFRFPVEPQAAIFITGGASRMSEEDKRLTRELFEQSIAPFAQSHNITVIDGATKSGVIEMMATARLKGKYTFPLVGIVPHKRVTYAGKVGHMDDTHELCPGHSHFVFVTGDDYGAESEMIVNMAHVLAGGERDKAGRELAAIGIVVNGGSITRQEAFMATSKYIDIPLIVMEGSGRFADELASAVRTGETSQALIRSIIDRGNVQLAATTGGPDEMTRKLEVAYQTDKDQFAR